MAKKKPTLEESKKKQKAGRRLDENIRTHIQKTQAPRY